MSTIKCLSIEVPYADGSENLLRLFPDTNVVNIHLGDHRWCRCEDQTERAVLATYRATLKECGDAAVEESAKLRRALVKLMSAASSRENTQGSPISLLEAQEEVRRQIREARELLASLNK